MPRFQTKPITLTAFRLTGPEGMDEAIAYGESHGWNVAITSKQLISLVDVTVARKGGGPSVLQLDPRGQALAFDEADGSPFPWFVINYSDLWSIYREIPSGV